MKKNNEDKRNRRVALTAAVLLPVCGLMLYGFYAWLGYTWRYDQVKIYPDMSDYFRDPRYYKINPKTVLADLDRGQTDVFMPEVATPEAPLLDGSISWHQADYMKVAKALFEFEWREPMYGWRLFSMGFDATCRDDPAGFDSSQFYYFTTIVYDDGEKGNIGRQVLITPQYGHVIAGGNAYYPYKWPGWRSLDLDKVVITAEDALRIAEENGGREARLSVQNKCKIRLGLSDDFTWSVLISKDVNVGGGYIFKIEIDPYTGEIIK
jgi:hypothetical protein